MYYKKFINKLIICLGILFLSSCASTSNITPTVYDKKTINPENVRLIFNRTNTFFYGGVDTRIEINGNVVTKLSRGSSFYYDLPAGRTNISVYGFMDPGKFSLDLNLIKSKIYEFTVSPRTDSFLPVVAFGLLGQLADTSINEQSGLFQISVNKYTDR